MWRRFETRATQDQVDAGARPFPRRRQVGLRFGSVAAACVGLVFLAAVGTWWMSSTTRPAHSRPRFAAVYRTQVGQQASLTLADGSSIVLAPATTLRVAEGFGAVTRLVEVEGEAHFVVAHAAGIPFLVHAGMTTTQVLGTAFLVRHYADDRRVRVVVESGKVAVLPTGRRPSGVTLTAGAVGDITDSSATTTFPADLASQTSWLDGRLVFDEAPTTDVLDAMTRWYGYRFQVQDTALLAKRLTVVLSTRSSQAALSSLELVLDAEFVFKGDSVIIRSRRTTHGAHSYQPVLRSVPVLREVGR